MTDNLALGPDGHANHTLTVLRNDSRDGSLSSDLDILPGFSIHADPALELSGNYSSPEGRILDLDTHVGANPGHWLALHLKLPAQDIRNNGVLGFVSRSSAPEILVARACLRSGTQDGFEDCFFDKHILVRPEETVHMDVLSVQYREQIPTQASWRELILFLPTQSFKLSLIDLRIFLV